MKRLKKVITSPYIGEVLTLLFGGIMFGVAMNLFLLPCEIVIGGVTGISTVLNFLFGLPVGVMIMIINVPLLIISAFIFGWRFLIRTMFGIIVTSLSTDLLFFLPVTTTDPLLCALLGGISIGVGCGLLFSRAYTTGGTDLVAWLLRRRFKRLSTGKLILLVDTFVVAGAAITTGNYQGILYSVIALCAYTLTVDYVMGGAERAKLAFIFTEHTEEVSDGIFENVGRGVTLLSGRGWYSKENREIIMCAVKRTEAYKLTALVRHVDAEAFVIFIDVSEVRGYGFKRYE